MPYRYHSDTLGFQLVQSLKFQFRQCMSKYKIPPVVPVPSKREVRGYYEFLRTEQPSVSKCIACGRIHKTSEDCDIPEPRESLQGELPIGSRMAVGYRLSRAEGMGFFNEGVLD